MYYNSAYFTPKNQFQLLVVQCNPAEEITNGYVDKCRDYLKQVDPDLPVDANRTVVVMQSI